MSRRSLVMLAVACASLTGCDAETAQPAAPMPGPLERFPAGEWEVTALTKKVQAKDQFAPQTNETVGKSATRKVCSPPGDQPAVALFAGQGSDCTVANSYARRGRLNLAYQCQRAGLGRVNMSIDGDFMADSFTVEAIAASSFAGQGDYVLTQQVTGKRLGDCPAAAAG